MGAIFPTLPLLIEFCMANKADGVRTKLTNICLIPNPHSDPRFEFYNKTQDSLRVPLSELTWDKNEPALGEGQFGKVFKARFRGNLDVAVKQLKTSDGEEGKKALEEFFKEIATMRGLNHPNLVQLFAYIINPKEGNFMVQEFMAQGDLKRKLQKMKNKPKEIAQENFWAKMLSWSVEVARGMAQLEKLGIVHRDLAARNVLLDQFNRAKVADFGLALKSGAQQRGDKLPIKWTAPEAFLHKEFTTRSDVWSFGILMYEILTVGANPYQYNDPKVTNTVYKERMTEEYNTYIGEGRKMWIDDTLRCLEPQRLPAFKVSESVFEDVVKVMYSCWDIEPHDRPSFLKMSEELDSLKSEYEYGN